MGTIHRYDEQLLETIAGDPKMPEARFQRWLSMVVDPEVHELIVAIRAVAMNEPLPDLDQIQQERLCWIEHWQVVNAIDARQCA